ncbi:unnamed protein product [Owenia fusiformis]|uniref:Uncharacterized protein n=1 Tax=Owenia fusiformis TaxID=6347 RepID=A0A8J1U9L4_OWEFU|nr:unnamed protein product [Owenia fusiformis]
MPTMKLKQRVVIFGLLIVGGILLVTTGVINSHLVWSNSEKEDARRLISSGHHIAFPRKNLDESNYTSDTQNSPEAQKQLNNVDTAYKVDAGVPAQPAAEPLRVNPIKLRPTKQYERNLYPLPKPVSLNFNLEDMLSERPQLKPHRKYKRRKAGHEGDLMLYEEKPGIKLTSWELFHNHINEYGLYRKDDPNVNNLIKDLQTKRIIGTEQKSGGTQLKLIMEFSNDGEALFKPMRFQRDVETDYNHYYFSDYERHYAEIAAFYLDRVFDFRRIPPTIGRTVNMTYDIKRLANRKLAKTFFFSPSNNVCFHGSCSYYCDSNHAVCGYPDLLEGSFAAFLPPDKLADRETWRHPWRRSYSRRRKAAWETDDTYCEGVRNRTPYVNSRQLLDLMDMAVFDFIQGNLDRHHYETMDPYGNETFPLHLDNGRGFGKTWKDEIDILAPIYQCCLMRYSTLLKLIDFEKGPPLSQVFRKAMERDLAYPILPEKHFPAIDRRVTIILNTVNKCIQQKGFKEVVIDDKL